MNNTMKQETRKPRRRLSVARRSYERLFSRENLVNALRAEYPDIPEGTTAEFDEHGNAVIIWEKQP